MNNKSAWLDVKYHQIGLYRQKANQYKAKRSMYILFYLLTGFGGVFIPMIMWALGQFLIGLAFLLLFPITMLLWKLSTHENRAKQLLTQLADAIELVVMRGERAELDEMRKETTLIETRFLSNDDELFVKKAIWEHFLSWKREKRDEEQRYDMEMARYNANPFTTIKPEKRFIFVQRLELGAVWNTDIPHRQGYKDSNTIRDEWAIMKAFRGLLFASYTMVFDILNATSKVAQQNPVVFERYLRKKKISKKMKLFKRQARVHYLSAAAKMRLVTFVDGVLSLEPTELQEATISLLHEKNEQIKKYTDEFWSVHRRSIKFYWFEALWLLLLLPFLMGAGHFISNDAFTEAVILFTVGASLVAFGEMALVVRQKIKLNGKKLIPPLIASLIGSRHSMCSGTNTGEGLEEYRRRFKNLEKHFIMTTPEIDSVKYVKDNLRDEDRTSKLHAADEICHDAQIRMDTYYRMFHLYRRKCLQYGALELFLGIMLIPVWGVGLIGSAMIGYIALDMFIPVMFTLTILAFEGIAVWRHIRVWRFKELYFKIYQGLSVLMVDGDLRAEPEKLNEQFKGIEYAALEAICTDHTMRLMAGTVSRTSGLRIPNTTKSHPLDKIIQRSSTQNWVRQQENRNAARRRR